ncbi:MAG: S-layer homology domain-containing protein [Candidatus Gracilibacteria bacterium]
METQTPNTSTPPVTPAPLSPTGTPEITPETSSNKKWFIIGGIIVALGIAAVVATTGGFLKGNFIDDKGVSVFQYKKTDGLGKLPPSVPQTTDFLIEDNTKFSTDGKSTYSDGILIRWYSNNAGTLATTGDKFSSTGLFSTISSILLEPQSGDFYSNYNWSVQDVSGNAIITSPLDEAWHAPSSLGNCVKNVHILGEYNTGYALTDSSTIPVYVCKYVKLSIADLKKLSPGQTYTFKLLVGNGLPNPEVVTYNFVFPKPAQLTSLVFDPATSKLTWTNAMDSYQKNPWSYISRHAGDGANFKQFNYILNVKRAGKLVYSVDWDAMATVEGKSAEKLGNEDNCVTPYANLWTGDFSYSKSTWTCQYFTIPNDVINSSDAYTFEVTAGDGEHSSDIATLDYTSTFLPIVFNKPLIVGLADLKITGTYYTASKTVAPKPTFGTLLPMDAKDTNYKVSWTYDGYNGTNPSFENLAFTFNITQNGSNELINTLDTQDACYKNFRWTCPYFNVSKALSSVKPGQTYTVSVATQLFATNDLTLSKVLHTSEDATTELNVKADPIIGDLPFAKTIDISKQYQFDKNTFQFDLSNKQIGKTIADTTCTYKPANVTATPKENTVTLNWNAAPKGQNCYYRIRRGTDPAIQAIDKLLQNTTFSDTNVPVGNYEYLVQSYATQEKSGFVDETPATVKVAATALAKPILATPQAILQKGKDLYTQITWTTDTNCKVTNGQCLSVWEIRDLDGKATYSLLNNATGIQDSNVKKVNGANSGAVVGTMSKSISLDTDFINAMKAGAYTFAVKNITIDNAFTKPILESDWATGNFTVKDKVTETPTLTVTPSKVEVGSIKASLEMSGITFPKNASINLYDTCAGCDIGDILTTADKLTAKITIPDTTKPTTVSVEVRDVATGGPVGKTTFDVIAKAAAPKSPTITEYSLNGTKNPGSITIEQGTKLSFVLTGTNLAGVVAGDISLGLAPKTALTNFKPTDTTITFDIATDAMAPGNPLTVTVASAANWKSNSFMIAAKLPAGGGGGAPVNLPAATVGSLAVSDAAPGKSVISFVVNVGDGATADMIITSVIKITHADKTVTTYATFVEKIKDGVKTYDYSLMPGKTEMQPGDVVTIETVLSAPTIAGAAAPAKDSVTKTYTYTPPVVGGNGGGGSSGGGGPAPGSMTGGGGGGGGGAVILQPGSTKFFKFPFKTAPFTSFKDVQKNNPFGTYITILNNGKLANGSSVISGYPGGQFFGPDDTLTRSQWLKMIMNSFQIPAPALAKADKSPCKDVSKTNWAAPYFTAGVKLGLVDVYDDGTCKAEQPISRGDATELLFLAIAKIDGKTQTIVTASVGTTDVNPFKDIAPQSPVYKYIVSAEKYGFVKGVAKGYFAPNQNLTRGQATKILVQALGKLAVK